MKDLAYQATHCITKENHASDKTHTEHLGSLARVGNWLQERYGMDNIKYLKKHSMIRYETYCSEEGFKVIKSPE